jgi:ABC-type uncharacterized transport system involved in gliding motility auxiliary subunit
MRTRRVQAAESLVATALLVLAAVLANAVAARWPVRVDLTTERRFTLAPETRALLAEADAQIEVRAYLPENVAAPYGTVVRAVRDELEEFRAASDGRLHIVWRDTSADDGRTALVDEAKGYGVHEAELQVLQADRRVRQRVLMGVAFVYRDRQAATAPFEDADRIEYALTRALRDALRGPARKPTIGIAQGHGEPDVLSGPLAELLSSSGTLRNVALDGRPLPDDLDALVVLAPSKPYTARDRYVIDQFLMQGRSLVALLDYRQQSAAFPDVLVPQVSGLEPLLADYGLKIDSELTVLDRTHALAVPAGNDAAGRPMALHHPLYAITEALDRGHPITRALPALVLPMAAPLDASGARGLSEVVELARTAPEARARPNVRSVDPTPLLQPGEGERPGPFTVAVAASGELRSAWADAARAVPPPTSRGEAPPADAPTTRKSEGTVRLVVATCGLRMLGVDRNGLLFFQNAVDWAVADTDLIGIRSRRATDPPLDAVDPTRRAVTKYADILGPPLLVVLFGVFRWRRRTR